MLSTTVDMTGWENSSLTGYAFVKETVELPEVFLSGTPLVEDTCTYLRLPPGQSNQIFFLSFTYDGKTITRNDLCQAWIDGLNGTYFYACMEKAATERSKIDVNYLAEVHRAAIADREWHGLFIELNLALTLLLSFERSNSIPTEWKPLGRYNLHDLSLSTSRLKRHCPSDGLSPLFLISAWKLLQIRLSTLYEEDKQLYTTDIKPGAPIETCVFPVKEPSNGLDVGSTAVGELDTQTCNGTEGEAEESELEEDDANSIAESTAPLLGSQFSSKQSLMNSSWH